jgi:drug/metabolite transporter (DMT)-like permease
LTRGLTLVPAGRATTIGYVQIVLAAAWGWLVFEERPTAWTIVGALLVAGGTWLLLARPSSTVAPIVEPSGP